MQQAHQLCFVGLDLDLLCWHWGVLPVDDRFGHRAHRCEDPQHPVEDECFGGHHEHVLAGITVTEFLLEKWISSYLNRNLL